MKIKIEVGSQFATDLLNKAETNIKSIKKFREKSYKKFIDENRKKKGSIIRDGILFKRLKEDESDEDVICRFIANLGTWDTLPWQLGKRCSQEKFEICNKYIQLYNLGVESYLEDEEYSRINLIF